MTISVLGYADKNATAARKAGAHGAKSITLNPLAYLKAWTEFQKFKQLDADSLRDAGLTDEDVRNVRVTDFLVDGRKRRG